VTTLTSKPRPNEPSPRGDAGAAGLEADIQATARALFALIDRSRPTLLSQSRWQDEMLDWAMADERLKVELFRFVDVFPTLRSTAEIARHLHEYFLQPGVEVPRALRLAIGATSRHSPLRPAAARAVRAEMLSFARRFIVGANGHAALPGLKELRDRVERAARRMSLSDRVAACM